MGRPAFRDEVRMEQARSAMGSIVLIRPLSFTLLTAASLSIAAIVLAYLVLAGYAKKATLTGTLVPASGAIRVAAPQAGLVRERHAREGEKVTAGEPLLRLVDSRATAGDGLVGHATVALAQRRVADIRRQRDGIRAAAGAEQAANRSRLAGLQAELAQLEGEIGAVEARESLARRALERIEELEGRGFASAAQRQQKEDELLDHRARAHAAARARLALEREIASLRASSEDTWSRTMAQLSALDAQVAALEQERIERLSQADAIVSAPASGTVAAVLVEPGQVVAAGTTLLTLLPAGSPLQAHLFAPSRSVGFIRAGQEVLLRYPAFPFQKFGSHRARVLSVSRAAMAPAELGFASPDGSRDPVYRVKVALDAQTVAAYGRAEPLQAGMQVEADVLLDRRRLIEWVFEPVFSLAGRA